MTTYAIKVQNTMRSTNPRYNTEGPMTLYHYIGRNSWMSGQPMYEGYPPFVVLRSGWQLT